MSIHMARAASLQWTGLPVQGLVAHYDFTDNSGHVLTDKSGNGYHGQLGSTSGADTNDPAWGSSLLTFDGVDDYVQATGLSGLNNGLTMVSVGDPAAISARQTFISLAAATNSIQLMLQRNNNGTIRVYDSVNGGGKFTDIPSGTDPVMLSARITLSDTAKIDQNGVQIDSYATGATAYNIERLQFGLNQVGTEAFSGDQYYQLLYNRALTGAEILRVYHYLQQLMAERGVTIE